MRHRQAMQLYYPQWLNSHSPFNHRLCITARSVIYKAGCEAPLVSYLRPPAPADDQGGELLDQLGRRLGLLRAHPPLLPGRLRLQQARPAESALQLRPGVQDGRVSSRSAAAGHRHIAENVPARVRFTRKKAPSGQQPALPVALTAICPGQACSVPVSSDNAILVFVLVQLYAASSQLSQQPISIRESVFSIAQPCRFLLMLLLSH